MVTIRKIEKEQQEEPLDNNTEYEIIEQETQTDAVSGEDIVVNVSRGKTTLARVQKTIDNMGEQLTKITEQKTYWENIKSEIESQQE